MVVNGKLETRPAAARRRAGGASIVSATSSVVSIGVWGAQGEIVTRVHGEEVHEVVQRLRQAHEGGERAGAKIEQTARETVHRKRQRRRGGVERHRGRDFYAYARHSRAQVDEDEGAVREFARVSEQGKGSQQTVSFPNLPLGPNAQLRRRHQGHQLRRSRQRLRFLSRKRGIEHHL